MTKKPYRWTVVTRIVISALIVLFAIGVVLLVIAFVLADQTGFEGKTLWDLMNLAFTPAVLAGVLGFAVWWLDKKRAETEQALALDRIREERLQTYLDRMQDLLEKGLKSTSPESDTLRDVARVRALTVFRGLDSERKRVLLLFLNESELLDKGSAIVLLKGADLRECFLNHFVANFSMRRMLAR